jgi:pSer/pThr/pTyr-binding forkhead associated (FHA) protein
MKVSLIVASGVHAGKSIPILGPKFLIGRDPECQLRPASQAVSKQHCAFHVREGKVFLTDFGSTNGTSVNDEQLPANSEREVKQGDRIKAGPLDFTLSLAQTKPSDSTPLPADLKAMKGPEAAKLKEAATGSKPAIPKPAASDSKSAMPKAAAKSSDDDDIAAMLLGMNEESPGVPEGSTIMEMPASLVENPSAEKKDDKPAAAPAKKDSSNAASDLLRTYMRRPR